MIDRRRVLKGAAAAAAAGAILPLGAAGASEPAPVPRLGVRRSGERGRVDHGWLDARHTFSFASYRDPRWMGFRTLRVINEDRVQPGKGFGWHPHRDMEILTYVLAGSLEHKDSAGNGGVIVPGEVQYMSAGTGIWHSEFNASPKELVHLLQIWILPERRNVEPRYAQKTFPVRERTGTLHLVASRGGRDGSIALHQDANLHAGSLEKGQRLGWRNPEGRHVWLQVARGRLQVGPHALEAGDAAYTSQAGVVPLAALEPSELLLFDLA